MKENFKGNINIIGVKYVLIVLKVTVSEVANGRHLACMCVHPCVCVCPCLSCSPLPPSLSNL